MSTAVDGLGAERHGADRLDAAQAVDLVGAGQMLRGDDGRRGLALKGGAQVVICGTPATLAVMTDMCAEASSGIFAAGHIAADRVDRDVLVAEDHAGQGLDLKIEQAGLLLLGEIAHLRLGEADVVELLRRELGRGSRGFPRRSAGSRSRSHLSNLHRRAPAPPCRRAPRCRPGCPRPSARTLASSSAAACALRPSFSFYLSAPSCRSAAACACRPFVELDHGGGVELRVAAVDQALVHAARLAQHRGRHVRRRRQLSDHGQVLGELARHRRAAGNRARQSADRAGAAARRRRGRRRRRPESPRRRCRRVPPAARASASTTCRQPTMSWLTILATSPSPVGPTWVKFAAIARRRGGAARCRPYRRRPSRSACRSPEATGPPETGASTQVQPVPA